MAGTKGVLHQEHLAHVLKYIFPNEHIVTNVKKDSDIINPSTGHHFEIDLWLPCQNLFFEFQDEYHYKTTWYGNLSLAKIRKEDVKRLEVSKRGFTIIQVPFWWDGSSQQLEATIHFLRPDLCAPSFPIPLNPPIPLGGIVPGVGELMYASFPPSVTHFENISKEDSCCIKYTRSGRVLPLPPKFIDLLPAVFLDCEIWLGRGSFLEVQRLVLAETTEWEFLRIIAFDSPHPAMHFVPFESRYTFILNAISPTHSFLRLAPRELCVDKKKLLDKLKHVINDEGEGVILRKPKSFYEPGRSSVLLKLKASRADTEGLVVSVERDQSFIVQLYDGSTLTIRHHNQEEGEAEVKEKIGKGDIVTLAFETVSRHTSMPVNARIVRVRRDVDWDDVVSQALQHPQTFASEIKPYAGFSGSTERGKKPKIRLFLENFARRKKKDPYLASTWYSLAPELMASKESLKMLQKHGGIIKALQKAFPDIEIKPSKFAALPNKFWRDVRRRRVFFMHLAKTKGLDPLSSDTWYSLSLLESILSSQRARSVLRTYNYSLSSALIHLFPEIGLDKSKINNLPGANNLSINTQRKLLLKFAEGNGFDALNCEGWYPITWSQIQQNSEIMGMLRVYAGNFVKMLMTVFPNVPFDKAKFSLNKRNSWIDLDRRRNLFIEFAKANNFDPKVAENWYNVTSSKIMEFEGFASMLAYYEGSFTKALLSLFPELELDLYKFQKTPIAYWVDSENARSFFISLAKELSFSPLVPDNWYSVPAETILAKKGASSILSYHGGNVAAALIKLFPDVDFDESQFSKNSKNIGTFWSYPQNRRIFFDNLARTNGLDPLSPDTWYSFISQEKFSTSKGVSSILAYYHGGAVKAILDLYPDIGLDPSKLPMKLSRSYWENSVNRKKVLLEYAKLNNINLDEPEHWYNVSADMIISQVKGASSMLAYYKSKLSAALLDLFPEVNFNKRLLYVKIPATYWENIENRKEFFSANAKERGLDPLLPSSWYNVTSDLISKTKGGSSLLALYKGDYVQSLLETFPNISLDKAKFIKKKSWQDETLRKKYFEDFAQEKKFDPLKEEGWYTYLSDPNLRKGAASFLQYYDNKLLISLTSLFPTLKLDAQKLHNVPHNYWSDINNRRLFFEEYAHKHKFDPLVPSNWNSVSLGNILATKKSVFIVNMFGRNLRKALYNTFPEVEWDKLKL